MCYIHLRQCCLLMRTADGRDGYLGLYKELQLYLIALRIQLSSIYVVIQVNYGKIYNNNDLVLRKGSFSMKQILFQHKQRISFHCRSQDLHTLEINKVCFLVLGLENRSVFQPQGWKTLFSRLRGKTELLTLKLKF